MKLPPNIEAEIGRGRQLGEYVDQWGLAVPSESVSAFARRIARMVAEDCADSVSVEFCSPYYANSANEVIRERYELPTTTKTVGN